jgi:hypothetical protein
MSRVFEKAYQATEQMINNYPVIYRKDGSGLSETLDKIVSGEYYAGKNITDPRHMSDKRIEKSDEYKDIVKNITAPPETLTLGSILSSVAGKPLLDPVRGGIRGLLKSDILEQTLAKAQNPNHKWGDKIPAQLKLYMGDYVPDRIVDGKREYNPITDKNVDEWFSKQERENIGKEITEHAETFLDYIGGTKENPNIGLPHTTVPSDPSLGSIYSSNPALGKYDYGHYDSTGKWQPGLPDFEGNFTIKDTWDWDRDQPYGPKNITERGLQALSGVFGRGGPTAMELQNLAEAFSQTVGAQAKEGEGRKIEFKVPFGTPKFYRDETYHMTEEEKEKVPRSVNWPYQLMTFLDAMDRPQTQVYHIPVSEEFGPTKGLEKTPVGMLSGTNKTRKTRSFDPYSVLDEEKKGNFRLGHTEGLPGIGWDAEAFDDDTVENYGLSAQDMADAYDLKGGGKVMNKGLTSIPDNLMINGQPHKLSYITPDEAKTLKAMGGSGRKVNGIPAYYFDDPDSWTDATVVGDATGTDDTDDFSSYGGADILAGTETLKDPETSETGIGVFARAVPLKDSGFVKGGFGPGVDPGKTGEKFFTQSSPRSRAAPPLEAYARGVDPRQYIRQANLLERALGNKEIVENQADIERTERQAYNEGYNAWRAGPGKYSNPDAYDAFFQTNKENMVAGFRSGVDPTSFALQQAANQNMQALSGLQQKAEEDRLADLGMGFERKGDTEKEVSKSVVESLQAGAIPGLTEVEEYKGLNIPVYMPGGMAAKGLDFISDMAGIIATGMMNGIPVNIHKDGKITAQSPENDPYFDYSKMELGNEPRTTQRRRVATETADATDVDQEEEFTGIKGLLARKGKPTTTSSALDALMRERVNTLYGRNIFA